MPGPPQKGQGVVDRLRRRIEIYRNRHEEIGPRYENTISNQNQQQKQETLLLRQRFLEQNKAKKSAKKSEKNKHSDSGGSSVGPSKSNKRQNEDDHGGAEGFEPPSKIGGAGRSTSSPLPSNSTNSSLYKQSFSQNGKRGGNKTKALDSQKYPSSSSNHSKNGIGRVPQPPPPIPPNSSNFSQCNNTTTTPIIDQFKKENNATSLPDFADLDQCAAALEKDAAKNGAITGGFTGESSTDEIFNSDVLNDLILEISDLNPEVMGNFYLDDGPPPSADDLNDVTLHGSNNSSANGTCNNATTNEPFHPVTPVTPTTASPMRSTNVGHGHLPSIKMEGNGGTDGTSMGVHGMERGLSHCAGPSPAPASTASPLASQLGSSHQPSPSSQSYSNSHFVMDNGQTGSPGVVNSCNNGGSMQKPSTRLPYSSPAGLTVDSPAAQTLKHMAEQHQHKAQMCMTSSPSNNGGVSFKNQGSVGSPAGSPYGTIGNYNGTMNPDFPASANTMNPSAPNCQIKQEVCSPGNPQGGFSPSPMMVDMQPGNKRGGQHNGSSPSGQSTRMPNMSSAGGSPIMSPISKSFNHPSPLNSNSSQGPQIPPSQQNPQQPQQASYMPMNRMPGPSQPYPTTNPRFSTANNSQISVSSPKSVNSGQAHVNDRGSPATPMDSKSQLRMNIPNPNMQQHQQQQQQPQFSQQQQQFHYGNGQNNNTMPMEMGFNPGHPQNSQMQPQPQQHSQSGQTINFTQQHLRVGNQGPPMPVARMPMPNMNRMGVPQRMPVGGAMPPDMQQQQQQQMQPRPMVESNQLPQRMIRPPPQGQHPRHGVMPPHQQMGTMTPQGMQQMNSGGGGGMPGQMVNRFSGMPGNPQMMPQQPQGYGMGGNMGMSGNHNMPMRRPYGPGPGFQGMNPRAPNEQMMASGPPPPPNSHNSMGSSEWMGNMGSMPDGSCIPYPQRQPQQMRPGVPPQQYHSGMGGNQGNPGPPQMPGNFGHDHMMGQQNPPFTMNVGGQNQQLHHQQSSQQQLSNFNHHPTNSSGMKMHPQQQQPQPPPVYGNSNNGFPMKHPDNNMMCGPSQNPMDQHHQQMPQQSNQMYMGNNNMMNSGVGQMNSNMDVSDPDFNLDLLVDGIGMRGDDDLLNTLDSVFS